MAQSSELARASSGLILVCLGLLFDSSELILFSSRLLLDRSELIPESLRLRVERLEEWKFSHLCLVG